MLVVTAIVFLSAGAGASQEPVISRSAPMTLTGEVVDIACYKQKGVAVGTGAAHLDCAKLCVLQKGAALGILSDGDGLFRLWGGMAKDKYAKLMPYLGQTVEMTGAEVGTVEQLRRQVVRCRDDQGEEGTVRPGGHNEGETFRRSVVGRSVPLAVHTKRDAVGRE